MNVDNYAYLTDKNFEVATCINCADLVDGQLEVLRVLDHKLFVSEEDYGAAMQEIMQLAQRMRGQPQE